MVKNPVFFCWTQHSLCVFHRETVSRVGPVEIFWDSGILPKKVGEIRNSELPKIFYGECVNENSKHCGCGEQKVHCAIGWWRKGSHEVGLKTKCKCSWKQRSAEVRKGKFRFCLPDCWLIICKGNGRMCQQGLMGTLAKLHISVLFVLVYIFTSVTLCVCAYNIYKQVHIHYPGQKHRNSKVNWCCKVVSTCSPFLSQVCRCRDEEKQRGLGCSPSQ